MLDALVSVAGLTIRSVQLSAGPHELCDDVLVTLFPAGLVGEEPFVRVAVFDPAENFSQPQHHATAQRAVSVARHWLRTEPDPIVALHGAARELYDPSRPADTNPIVALAWADLQLHGAQVKLLAAGRAADCDLVVVNASTPTRALCLPMLNERARASWSDALARTRKAALPERWAARRWHERMQVLQVTDWDCPPLGLTASPKLELLEGDQLAKVSLCDALVLATDGLELDGPGLDHLVVTGQVGLDHQVAALVGRRPPAGMPYPHGDIAALLITAALGN